MTQPFGRMMSAAESSDTSIPLIGLLLTTRPEIGGSFQYSLTILEAFASLPLGSYRLLVAYSDPLWEPYLSRYSVATVRINFGLLSRVGTFCWREAGLPMQWLRKITALVLPAARIMGRQQGKLWIYPSQDGWSYQLDLPALVAVHDLMHRYERRFPEVSVWGLWRERERHYRNICSWSKGTLVDSQLGQEQLHESYGIGKDKIHILPFIAPDYILSTVKVAGFDTRYNLPKKFIFYPAQFWTHKNHLRLIKALAVVRKDCPDARIVLAGSKKNAYPEAKREIDRLGLTDSVHIFGYVPNDDIVELYRRARAMMMPTFFGPTNIPPLEAMALGCPIAVSNVYGMPEQVGDAALLFDPESVEEIADCMRRLWLDDKLCSELIKKGLARVSAKGAEQFNERFRRIVAYIVIQSNENEDLSASIRSNLKSTYKY